MENSQYLTMLGIIVAVGGRRWGGGGVGAGFI